MTATEARTVRSLVRVEASLLLRNVLVLAGLVAGGVVIWILIRPLQPLWWKADWDIGGGQLALGMAVLVAAQLAAGRARRESMADLYASFPASAGTRTVAHLVGLVGAVPASLLLIGVAAAVVQLRGAIGVPSITVLAGGVLVVIAAGATGIAIAARFPHPLAGVLGALVLFITSATTHLASAAGIWLLPWAILQDQLGSLPGPMPGYPPVGAHLVELAGIAVLAGAVALAATASRARARGGLATAGIVAVAAICLAGALQLRPIPTADLNHLVGEVSNPASVQRCATTNQVRYCAYRGFGSVLPSLQVPVNGVLAHLPARPAQPLTVMQVLSPSLLDATFTHGHSTRQVSQWQAQMRRAPGNAAATSAIYLSVGSWPADSGQQADARFDVALATALWAVHFPPATGNPNGQFYLPCVPVDQAREAIAIWLAILATHPPLGELQNGLSTRGGSAEVHNAFIPTWAYPGSNVGGYLTPSGAGPQTTAAGYLLAQAMTTLPEQKVAHVLRQAWGSWLNWHTTDAQLAAALGIRMPSPPALPPPMIGPGPGGPQNPLCAS
jgi:hypothetical protein